MKHETSHIDELVWIAYSAKVSHDEKQIEEANEKIKDSWNGGAIGVFQRDALWRILFETEDATRYNKKHG